MEERIKLFQRKLMKEKGITLAALVVTIVILIILATVTISATFGENGLIRQSEEAKDIAENSIAKENEDLNKLEQEYANLMGVDGEIPPSEIDKTPPTVEIVTGEITDTSIVVTVNATDNESGLAESGTYKYYLNGQEKVTSESNSYTFTGLTAGTEYTIKVEVFDKAGNKGENSIKVSTVKPSEPTVQEKLKVGDYVNYIDGKGITRKCVVLYDNTSSKSSNEVQIITMDKVESVTLGSNSNFEYSKNDYNNAISILNEKSNEYINYKYSNSARSVGSIPNNPNYSSGYYNNDYYYFNNYKNTMIDEDNNFQSDYNIMKKLNIENIKVRYWLASRYIYWTSVYTDFLIRVIDENGKLLSYDEYLYICKISTSNNYYMSTSGLRPVFNLKPDIKVTDGNGSEASPYELGV